MRRQHWQDWANLALGLWIFISPWTITHTMAGPGLPLGLPPAAMWLYYVCGILIAIVAASALLADAAWLEWLNLGIGVWLCVAPWALEFSSPPTAIMWNGAVAGVLVAVFAGMVLADEYRQNPAAR